MSDTEQTRQVVNSCENSTLIANSTHSGSNSKPNRAPYARDQPRPTHTRPKRKKPIGPPTITSATTSERDATSNPPASVDRNSSKASASESARQLTATDLPYTVT